VTEQPALAGPEFVDGEGSGAALCSGVVTSAVTPRGCFPAPCQGVGGKRQSPSRGYLG